MEVEKLTEVLGVQNKTTLEVLRACTYGVFAYLSIDVDVVAILSVLMVLDMIFGVAKSIRLNIKICLKTLTMGFVTKIALFTIPMVVALMGKALGRDFVWMVDLTAKMLVVNEGFSILANILSIKQGKKIENFDFISLLVDSLRDFFINKLKSIIDSKK